MLTCLRSTLMIASLLATLLCWGGSASSASTGDEPVSTRETGTADADAGDSAESAERQQAPTVTRLPVWEFGIGGGYFSGYDYPASRDENRRIVALPFFIYRSPQFRLGSGGLRAVAIENPLVKLDLSISGSLNASSEGNRAREGMPNLDFLFEIGPQLEVRLLDRKMASGGRLLMRFTSEVRAVLSTDFSKVDDRGVVVEAGVGINHRNWRHTGIDLFSSVDMTAGSERLQDYFYEVDEQYATGQRPIYDARSGYLKSSILAGVGLRPHRNLRLFLAAVAGLHEGASNQDSPLFETTSSVSYAIGLVWTIKTSEAFVDIVDMGSNN